MPHAVTITGIGSEVPARRITNADWEKLADTTDEWIVSNLGIRERSRIEEDRSTADLGIASSRKALQMAEVEPDAVDFVLCATNSQEDLFPSTASKIQKGIEAERATSMDLQAGCTGWLYGMRLASALVASGEAQAVLVVGTEALTRSLNLADRSSTLFGDASGAAIVQRGHQNEGQPRRIPQPICATRTIPSRAMQHPTIYIEENNRMEDYISGKDMRLVPRPLPTMDGRASLKLALTSTLQAVDEVLDRATAQGINPDEIDLFVPHQTNVHIIKKFCEHVGVAFGDIPYTLERYGGLSTAGIPTGIAEHNQRRPLEPGALVLVCGYGAGFTSGAMLFEWGKL